MTNRGPSSNLTGTSNNQQSSSGPVLHYKVSLSSCNAKFYFKVSNPFLNIKNSVLMDKPDGNGKQAINGRLVSSIYFLRLINNSTLKLKLIYQHIRISSKPTNTKEESYGGYHISYEVKKLMYGWYKVWSYLCVCLMSMFPSLHS